MHKNKKSIFNQKWFVAGLVFVLVFAVGSSALFAFNKKASKSQASLCKPNEKKTDCIKPKGSPSKKMEKKSSVQPPQTNPYTGQKQ